LVYNLSICASDGGFQSLESLFQIEHGMWGIERGMGPCGHCLNSKAVCEGKDRDAI